MQAHAEGVGADRWKEQSERKEEGEGGQWARDREGGGQSARQPDGGQAMHPAPEDLLVPGPWEITMGLSLL